MQSFNAPIRFKSDTVKGQFGVKVSLKFFSFFPGAVGMSAAAFHDRYSPTQTVVITNIPNVCTRSEFFQEVYAALSPFFTNRKETPFLPHIYLVCNQNIHYYYNYMALLIFESPAQCQQWILRKPRVFI